MKIVKIIGKKYDVRELEENSKIIRKWFVIKQLKKEELVEKYYEIKDPTEVTKMYEEMIQKADNDTKKFYQAYIEENWKETFPIMRDVSAFAKIRPNDGTEFCLLI